MADGAGAGGRSGTRCWPAGDRRRRGNERPAWRRSAPTLAKKRSGLSHSGTGPVASPTPKFPHPWSMAGNEAVRSSWEEDVAGDHGQVHAQAGPPKVGRDLLPAPAGADELGTEFGQRLHRLDPVSGAEQSEEVVGVVHGTGDLPDERRIPR